MAESRFLSFSNFNRLVQGFLQDSRVIAPIKHNQRNILQEITLENVKDINLFGFRTVESFKSYLFKPTEKVARYFGEDVPARGTKRVFLGARGCDLEAFDVLDRVLSEGEFKDPFYIANHQDTLVIGADCTDCGKTCFCTMVKGKPFPQQLYDLNLSPIDEGYVVEAGTGKGRKLIDENSSLFTKASSDQIKRKDRNRETVNGLLKEVNKDFECRCTIEWTEAHKRNLENHKAWRVITKDCVECSACNFVCPSCTCFLLLDSEHRTQSTENRRDKVWDACLKAGYARVAGGANSRPKLYERLQNRYHCKFDYSCDRLGRYTCVGCGRCIDGCAGNIDMRKVYAELVRQVPLTAKLE